MSINHRNLDWKNSLRVYKNRIAQPVRVPAMKYPVAVRVTIPLNASMGNGLNRPYLYIGSLQLVSPFQTFFVKKNLVGDRSLLRFQGKNILVMTMMYTIKKNGVGIFTILEYDVSLPVVGRVHDIKFVNKDDMVGFRSEKKVKTVPVPCTYGGQLLFLPD